MTIQNHSILDKKNKTERTLLHGILFSINTKLIILFFMFYCTATNPIDYKQTQYISRFVCFYHKLYPKLKYIYISIFNVL